MTEKAIDKLVLTIDSVIKSKSEKESINIIEKQFYRKGLLNDWLEFYFDNYYDEENDSFFEEHFTNVFKLLLFLKKTDLLNPGISKETVFFIKKMLSNIESFNIIFKKQFNMKNIINKCEDYMGEGCFLDIEQMEINNPIFKNTDENDKKTDNEFSQNNNFDEKKNTVELNNSVNINDKSDSKINLSDHKKNNDNTLNNTVNENIINLNKNLDIDDQSYNSKNTVDNRISVNSSPYEILETENLNIKNVNEKKRKKYSKKDKGEKLKKYSP